MMNMTLEQLQADLAIINTLMDGISAIFPTPIENQIVTFLKMADNNIIVQNIILLVINQIQPVANSVPERNEDVTK